MLQVPVARIIPLVRRGGVRQWKRINRCHSPPICPDWIAKASTLGILGAAAIKCFLADDASPCVVYCDTSSQRQPKKGGGPFRLKQVYEIEQCLGEGSYGMVYKARRKADGAVVALKTMPRKFTGKTDFEREVAALQLLSKPPGHQHVVQLYDLHRDEKNYYLAMELIKGGELMEHLLENGPYSEAIAASFLRQFAEAISFVHSTGLTHADLKLENLMLSSNDVEKAKIKVVDFGCAHSHDLSRKDMQLPAHEFATGCSFLHQAALGNRGKLETMLKERPALVNFRDYDRRTALHVAASEGHTDICRYLVERGARINRSDRWGGFPLDDAHRHQHSDVVQFLRQHGAKFGSTSRASNLITAAAAGDKDEVKALLEFSDIDLNQGDYDHRTALHLAANEGHLEVVELLCKAGADIDVEDRWGYRPLNDAKNAKRNSASIVNLLEKHGAKSVSFSSKGQQEATMHDLNDLATQDDKSSKREEEREDAKMTLLPAQEFAMGCNVLFQAALGNQFELEKILQERPALVNFRDYDRRTALHIAASEGHTDICRYLVERGARINRSDRWGGSPLDDAHRHKHCDVVQYLREQGARFGSTSQATNFITAASEGDTEEVKALLEFGNIDLNQGDYDRRTALHLAAGEGRSEIVEMLCDAGADVNVKDRWGNCPLDDAKRAKKDSAGIIKLLQKHGAKFSTMVQHEIAVDDSKDPTTQQNEPSKQDEENESLVGTIAYCPPEQFSKGASLTPTTDMWAAGVIMFILLTGTHPFDKFADRTDDDLKKVLIQLDFKNDGHLKLIDELVFDERIEGLSDSCVELMRHLLQPDPDKRMSSDDFLRHPWIQGLTASWKTLQNTHDELKASWQNKFRTAIQAMFGKGASGERLSENDLAEMFDMLDMKNKGVLELEEIKTAFCDSGISERNIRAIFASADLDGTGVIHWDEFQALMSKQIGDGPGLQASYLKKRFKTRILENFDGTKTDASCDNRKLREIFNAMDLEGNGVLDPHEIRIVLRSAGEPEDVISRIVASLDLNHDGRVRWEEFLEIMSMNDE